MSTTLQIILISIGIYSIVQGLFNQIPRIKGGK